MPTCAVCGKDVHQDASFCPSCGSNLQATQIQQPSPQQSFPIQEQIPGEQLRNMVKRLERVSYITAAAAVILLIVIILVLF
ncbi:MAG TPA: hypothetical protein VNE86_01475 [Nitrososphaerales archaeon]|nr:hypothetical protein [Nitrososphaerales archaeon]